MQNIMYKLGWAAFIKKSLLFVVLVMSIALVILFNCRISATMFNVNLYVPEEISSESELRVQFLGNTTLLFSDGETAILTDGFFTRPGMFQLLFGKIAPDSTEITRCLRRAGIGRLQAVIPLHSHFDHAMDAPLVARLTGAKLIGSSSTANIGKGCQLPDSLITIPPINTPIQIGKFTLTFLKTNHWQYPDANMRALLLNNAIETPLTPPAKMEDYKEGTSYTLLIKHDTLQMAIQGSAGYAMNALSGYNAHLLFAGIGGLELMDEVYNNAYQQQLIEPLNPSVIIPVHWDDFTAPLAEEPKMVNLFVSWYKGINPSKALNQVISRNVTQKRPILILPLWKPVSVKQLLKKKV